MRLIYANSSKVTKLEQKMNNSESFLLLLKNLLKCTYEVLLPSQRYAKSQFSHDAVQRFSFEVHEPTFTEMIQFSERPAWTTNAEPDHTAPRGSSLFAIPFASFK